MTTAALIYLAIPNLIFVFGWFKLPFALPLAGLILIALYQARIFNFSSRSTQNRGPLIPLVIVSLAWSAFGGAGNVGYANPDWYVRDTVYADLFKNAWPISYGMDGDSPLILRSAIGYFLPPALLTSWLGQPSADVLLYLWTAAGVFLFLAMLPLPRQMGKHFLLCLLIVIFFSGMDFLGTYIATGYLPIFPLRLEWWTYFSYTSLGGQLFWGPNHNLPLWLGTALYIRHANSPGFARLAITFVPLTLIWTPFAAIGLAPFLALYAVRWWNSRSPWPGKLQLVYALTICTLFATFLTLNISGIPTTTGIAHAKGAGTFWPAYFLFVLMEFLALALLLWGRTRQAGADFVVAVAVLLSLPFVFFGPSNDLLLRASVPPLLILLGYTLHQFNPESTATHGYPWLIIFVLLVGAATPFNEMWRAATWPVRPSNYGMTLLDVNDGHYPAHYIGKLDLPWLAAMLKTPQPATLRQSR